jgi:hypothetical protein
MEDLLMSNTNKYMTGKQICSLLNKDCEGPIGYYLIKGKTDKLGMVVRAIPVDVTVGGTITEAVAPNDKYPPEVFNILPTIKYVFQGNNLIIKIKENLPLEEFMVGQTYKIYKTPYARSFLYLIEDFDKKHLNDLLLGLAFSIYIERQKAPEETEENSESNEGFNSGLSFGGGNW